MKLEYKLKYYSLYLGIALYLIGAISLVLLSLYTNQEKLQQTAVFEFLSVFPPLVAIFITLVFASVFEEFAFRGWTMRNKFGKYISLSGILFFYYITLENIYLCGIVFIVLLIVFFKKNSNQNPFLAIIVTSILFGFIHFNNFSGSTKYLAILQLIGLALILCFFAIRYGFVYSILLHFANNMFALILIMTLSVNDYSCKIENENYLVTIEKVSNLNMTSSPNYFLQDSIAITGNITTIASRLAPFNTQIIYKPKISNINIYQYIAICKTSKECVLNQESLLIDFLQYTKLSVDTLIVEAYFLDIIDTTKLKVFKPPCENVFSYNIADLVFSLRDIFNKPIVFEEGIENVKIVLSNEFFKSKSFDEISDNLKLNYGIEIKKKQDVTATIVSFSERNVVE